MCNTRLITKISTTLAIAGLMNIGGVAWAATQFSMTTPINLSNQAVLAGGSANKTKLVRLGNGTLISVFGDAVGSNLVYDLKGDAERIARDIFMTRCNPLTAANACTLETDWSTPVNLSNSALLTSMQANWRGAGQENYYGDSDKPAIHSSGPMATVTWGDKYCPDGDQSTPGVQAPVQRAVAYIERDDRVVPFNCMYESHSLNNGATWSAPQQLSNGIRDAKQDSNKGAYSSTSGIAKWSIVWQEDPLGLQIGQAEGPGEGASGAKVSHGTDVWYTTTSNLADLVTSPWTVVRLTNNFDGSFGVPGSTNPVRDGTGAEVDPGTIEKGNTGASRPNLAVVSGQALVAYEETKRSIDVDEGKYIRYHNFPQTTAPTSDSGCILSTPTKNGRRVRFATQGTPGPNDMRMAIFWKEGEATQGGPSDIVARIGFADFTAANMVPAVDTLNCEENDYNTIIGNLNNTMGYNISTESPTATTANLADDTELNWIENALAHRALLRGDDLYVGYAYTADLAQQAYTNTDNYNFWIRHYNAATATWDNPVKVTNITDTSVDVREPRLVGTPGNGPNCPGGVPTDPTNLQQCQDRNTFIVAWGTRTNVSAWDPAGPEDLTIFMTRTTDKGVTYEPAVQVPTVATGASESQLRPTPDGNTVYITWNQSDAQTEGMFSVGTPIPLIVFSDMVLSVTSIPTDVLVGSDIDISYDVENLGPEEAFDVSLVINLPASVTYLSGDASCTHNAGIVTCTLGDMVSAGSTPVDISVQSTVEDLLTFTATVAISSPHDPDAGNNQVVSNVNATITGLPSADIAVSASADPSILKEGRHTNVSIVLMNNGPFAATDAVLTINTPAGWEQSSLTISQGSCRIAGSSFICDVGDLASGASSIVKLNGSVDDDGTVRFLVNGSAAEFDPDMANNASDVTVEFKKDNDDDDNWFGCTVGKPGGFDPTLLFVVIISLLYLTRRKLKEAEIQE